MARSKEPKTLPIKAQQRILATQNVRIARKKWGVAAEQIAVLRALTKELQLSVTLGDLRLLDGKWYVTHAGLLRIARRRRCSGIRVHVLGHLSDPAADRWVFKATVYKTPRSRGFVGYGDADPSEYVSIGPRRRNARCRDASRQPGSPKSLWSRALQCRRTRVVLCPRGRAAFEWSCWIEGLKQWTASASIA